MAVLINRGRNKWLVRVFKGRDHNGRQVFVNKTITGTKEEAGDWAVEEKKKQQGTANYTVGNLLDSLLDDYRINGKSIAWAKIVCDTHLRPYFGKLKAVRLTTDDARQYTAARQAKGRANGTINRELALLRRAFNLARQDTPPKIAVVPYIPTLEENNVRKGFFEDEQYRALLVELPNDLKPVLAFGYYTGCRRGEVLSLRWTQVDLVERIVRLEVGETKNKDARTIPLMSEMYELLAVRKAIRDQNYPSCPWLFANELGERIKGQYLRKCWREACKRVGLWDPNAGKPGKDGKPSGEPTRLFHDFRRSAVRNLVRAGVPETVAQRISGHKTRAVFDRYNITSEADLKESAIKLQRYHDDRRKADQEQQPSGSCTMVAQAAGKPS